MQCLGPVLHGGTTGCLPPVQPIRALRDRHYPGPSRQGHQGARRRQSYRIGSTRGEAILVDRDFFDLLRDETCGWWLSSLGAGRRLRAPPPRLDRSATEVREFRSQGRKRCGGPSCGRRSRDFPAFLLPRSGYGVIHRTSCSSRLARGFGAGTAHLGSTPIAHELKQRGHGCRVVAQRRPVMRRRFC